MTKITTKLMGLALGVVLAVGAAGLLLACDTPVYRYSMYTWDPAGYTVFVMHDGDESVAQPLMDAVAELNSEAEGPTTNLWCVPVDISTDPHLRTVPTPVAEAWGSLPDQSTPRCVVMSPKGAMIHGDMLTPEDLTAMVDSPKRQELAEQLQEGKVGVFIYLADSDTPEDDRALLETQAFIAALADGAIELLEPTGPPGYVPSPDSPESKVEVGFVRVDRDDPNEQWLVNMLLHVEDDLNQFQGEPMVFAAFGRCRVLEPYVGNGIIMENLAESIDFIRGACSCTVRDENPGLDMLTYYNWEMAATLMAQKFGAEEGATRHLGGGTGAAFPQGIFPEIIPLEPTAGGSDRAPVRTLSPEVIDAGRGQGIVSSEGTSIRPQIADTSEEGTAPEEAVATTTEETAVDPAAGETEVAVEEGEAVLEAGETEVAAEQPTENEPSAEEVYEESLAAEQALEDAAEGLVEHEAAAEIDEVAAATPELEESSESSAEEPGMAGSVLWTMLIGAGLGVAVLLGATFFLFRPTA